MAKEVGMEFAFFEFLRSFYVDNKGIIRNRYREITKKYLDYNDKEKNPDAFLRTPQFEALEMYVFVKEFMNNQQMYQMFDDWSKRNGVFSDRRFYDEAGQMTLYDVYSPKQYHDYFLQIKKYAEDYPNYIFALTMGLGKTILMAKGTSLRNTINELSKELSKHGSKVVACYNFTGTPYVNNKILPEVVYAYGLQAAIRNNFLKDTSVIGYSNVKNKEFLKAVITDFWAKYGGKEYEGLAPKMAIFGAEITEVRDEIRPVVEEVLSELGIPLDKILVNVGDEKITKSEDIRDFNNLDIAGTAGSKKQFILLVNKGREGWNCRSLFSVALFRSPKSKVFVLQATMRCLRKITDEQLTATVYLSKENMDILDDELKKNFRTSIEELVVKKDKKRKKVPVRVKEPPRTLRMNRLHYKYSLETKPYDRRLSFGLKEIETENYDATMYVKEGLTTSSVVRERNVNYMVSKLVYTEIMLAAEVAKYFPDIRCTEVARILRESEEGIDEILVAVNEHNDIIYDKIVPTIFEALYKVNKEIVKENVDVKLLKKPKEGGYYEFSGNEDLILTQNSEDSVVMKNKGKSFHADTYVFDSKPELQLFLQLLANEHVKQAYFTGMFTADQTDFYVPYIDPESNRLRKYYPDFLVKMDDGSYLILEVKGDNMIDDPVVKAKGAAAEEVAVESSMKYEMLKGTDIMTGNVKI